MRAPGLLFLVMLIQAFPANAETNASILQLRDGWSYRWGDSPRDAAGNFHWLRDRGDDAWLPTEDTGRLPGREGRNQLWLRVRLPPNAWREPVIFIRGMHLEFEA